jgi:probable HAF family extracellular repeat protein
VPIQLYSGKMKYITAGILALLFEITIARAETPHYSFTDLGSLGGAYTSAYAINSNGAITGVSTNSSGVPFSFYYQNGTMTPIAQMASSLSVYNMDLNDSGLVVNANEPPFSYQNGVTSPLGPFPDGAQIIRVNNAGLMVVTSDSAHVSTYDGTTFTPINALVGLSWAYDIADDGTIVGTSGKGAFIYKDGTLTDLSTLVGGKYSTAYSINTTGTVVGGYVTSDNWSHAFMYSGGSVINLEGSPITFSEAYAVNNFGVAVGVFGVTEDDRAGFVYQNGIMSDLNSLVDLPAGYTIQDAIGINDAGQIIATLDTTMGIHAVLLTPAAIPEPGSLALTMLGLLLGAGAWKAHAKKRAV